MGRTYLGYLFFIVSQLRVPQQCVAHQTPFFVLREIWHEEGWGFRTTLISDVSSGITMIRLVVTTISKGANCWWDEACKENVWKWVKHHNFLHVPTVTEKKRPNGKKPPIHEMRMFLKNIAQHWSLTLWDAIWYDLNHSFRLKLNSAAIYDEALKSAI